MHDRDHEELEHRILACFNGLCEPCEQTVRVVVGNPHDRHAFARASELLGFTNRRALVRRLRKHGFPSARRLQDWCRVLRLLEQWERHGAGLEEQAYDIGVEPGVLRRAVRRVTTVGWREARVGGFWYWFERFRAAIGARVHCGRGVR